MTYRRRRPYTLLLAFVSLLLLLLLRLPPANSIVARNAGIWHDAKARLAIRVPAGWHVMTRKLTTITQPVQRFVVYTGTPPRSLVQRASPKTTQALAIIMEQAGLSAADLKQFPRRPRRFTVRHLGRIESFAGDRWAERVFREGRRGFYVFIWVGANDTSQLPILLTTLDSLRVS